MAFRRAVLIEVAPRSWFVLAMFMLVVAVFVALVVMLLVGGSEKRRQEDPSDPPIVHGSCAPFCTATPVPAPAP